MSTKTAPPLPDHTQLPGEDGTIVHKFEALKQSMLLTDCLMPVLERLHPDGRYCIGQDTGIYWRLHRLVKGHYRRQRPNSRGHYAINGLGV